MPPNSPPRDLAETIILPSPVAENTRTSGTSQAKAEVVAGSRPHIESETQSLLRVRLQAAAIVLSVAVGLFFVRGFFLPQAPLRWLQGVVAVALGSCVLLLRSEASLTMKQLRSLELGIFGLITGYLAMYQYAYVQIKAEAGNDAFALAAIKSNVMYVFGVIMLYGTFIPNTWKRTLAVVLPMALVPALMMALLQFRSGAVRAVAEHVGTFEQISDNGIILIFGAVAATIGAHTINQLRQVAFKARQLGQYRLKEKIGGGGMGEVYLAEHQLLKRPCAIKLIRPGNQADRAALARFEAFRTTLTGPSRASFATNLPGASRSSQHRPRASRHQAGEHLCRGARRCLRCRQVTRFRSRSPRGIRSGGPRLDPGRNLYGHPLIHVARTGIVPAVARPS